MEKAQNSQRERKPFLLRIGTVLPFGKHTGEKWEELAKTSEGLGYLAWLFQKDAIDFEAAAWNVYQDALGNIKDKKQIKTLGSTYGRSRKNFRR